MKLYDLEKPILYFPIRHHSPACSFHLKKAIEAYQPDCILVEGPANAEHLIPVLASPDTKAPLALYYFYKDSKGLLSKEKESYRCYYPFLDASPELTALREAAVRKIPAQFIDLPYGEILLNTVEGKGIRAESEKQTYNDDYLLSRSRYLALLCEKSGMREFEELWEKYFEIEGIYEPTGKFVEQMFTYCYLSRVHMPKEEMEDSGCLCRERFMAERIGEASRKYRRLLVVTGGFHTWGLLGLLEPEADGNGFRLAGEALKLHKIEGKDTGVYPLAYSMEAADALNGYASGMQSPGFYQLVFEGLEEEGDVGHAYQEAVLGQLVKAGREARRKGEGISSYDVICALSMARGLAALRGKREPGLYELRDAALSSFVKGELSLSTDLPLRILDSLNTGKQVGKLCETDVRPPLLSDFEEQCRRFGLKLLTSAEKELTLEIFTKQKHMALSRFLYQMEFLGTEFAKRKKGPDLLNRKDKSRVREVWRYRFSSQVPAALIDVSVAGSTVEEAARSQLVSRGRKSAGCREAARLLVQGFLMGFLKERAGLGAHMGEVLATDGDFFSLTEGFSYLEMLYELQELYQVEDEAELAGLLLACFQKIVQLLPSMASVKEEKRQECMECFRSLYQMTGRKHFSHYRPVLMEALGRLVRKDTIDSGLHGAALGLLYSWDRKYEAGIQETAAGYLMSSGQQRMKSAPFLRGLFYTARDYVFVKEGFLSMVDHLLGTLSAEEFLKLLPELRMAFGYFTPLETDRIAAKAAALHAVQAARLLKGRAVSPLEYEYGELLDAYGASRIQEEEPWTEGIPARSTAGG